MNGDAEVGLHAIVPGLADGHTAGTDQGLIADLIGDREPGAVDDGVDGCSTPSLVRMPEEVSASIAAVAQATAGCSAPVRRRSQRLARVVHSGTPVTTRRGAWVKTVTDAADSDNRLM